MNVVVINNINKMDTDTMTVGVCALVVAALMKKKRKRKTRTVWVKQWIKNRVLGHIINCCKNSNPLDVSSYRNFVRMDAATFEVHLTLTIVAPLITQRY